MKQVFFFLSLCLTFIVTQINVKAQTWSPMGPDDSYTLPNVEYPSMSLSSTNSPYVVFKDTKNGGKASVLKANGTLWSNLGTPAFSSGAVYNTDIALTSSDVPYVVYMDASNSYKATVKRYDGSSWVTVGTEGISKGSAGFTTIAVGSSNTVYIAYSDAALSEKVCVKKWSGTGWVSVGPETISSGAAQYVKIVTDNAGTPYIIFRDENESYKAVVKKYDGTQWVMVGGLASTSVADYTDIAFDSNNIPYIMYVDATGIVTKKLVTGAWVSFNTLTGQSGPASLKISKDNTPYLFLTNGTNPMLFKAISYAGGPFTWSNIYFSSGISNSVTSTGDLAFASDNSCFLMCTEGSQLLVKKYTPTTSTLEDIKTKGFNTYNLNTYNLGIAVNPVSGNLYVAYVGSSGQAVVQQFSNGSWQDVGPFPSVTNLYQVYIAFSTNGTPFISCVSTNQTQIKRYINSQWSNYGTAINSSTGQLSVLSNGDVYINNSNVLKKYNSGIWVDVALGPNQSAVSKLILKNGEVWGTASSTNTSNYYLKNYTSGVDYQLPLTYSTNDIKEDKDGNICFISPTMNSSSTPPVAMKFNNGQFTALPSIASAASNTSYFNPFLLVSGDKSIYAVYYESGTTGKIQVKKYLNGSWTTWGDVNAKKISSYLYAAAGISDDIFVVHPSSEGVFAKTTGVVLPITLLSFKASKSYESTYLSWSTSSELNNDYFTLERSINGTNFEKIGKIPSKGNTAVGASYNFYDYSPVNGKNYYRLSQTDKDGTSKVIGIKAVDFTLNQPAITLFPNPMVNNQLNINLPKNKVQSLTVEICDLLGQVNFKTTLPVHNEQLEIHLKNRLTPGAYIVKVGNYSPVTLLVK